VIYAVVKVLGGGRREVMPLTVGLAILLLLYFALLRPGAG